MAFVALILIALARPILRGATMPRFWPLAIGILSSCLLYFARPTGRGSAGLIRIGFFVGMFAFFIGFPITSPDEINPEIAEDIHWTLGWALCLSVLGFEAGYWILSLLRKAKDLQPTPLEPSGKQRNLLLVILALGVATWFFSVWDYSNQINVPIVTILLTMRGTVEGSSDELAKPGPFTFVLGSGIFLSAVAASLLVTRFHRSIKSSWYCWLVLLACATIGFLNGSRAVFLYSFIPIAVTGWKKLSGLRVLHGIRWPGAIAAGIVLLVIWSAMTEMRGSDIRNYEGGNEISAIGHAQGAFDIYSMTAVVVETFPDRIPFVEGESIVPLVLGWVPRSVWPSKPYPFGLYMNIINGETLQARAASLAVGLTGEGYGNFGLFGAFLWAFVLGIVCRQGDMWLERLHPNDTLHLLLGGMAMVWVAMIVRGGVPEMFYMGLQIMVLPLVLTKLLFARQKKAANRLRFSRHAPIIATPASLP